MSQNICYCGCIKFCKSHKTFRLLTRIAYQNLYAIINVWYHKYIRNKKMIIWSRHEVTYEYYQTHKGEVEGPWIQSPPGLDSKNKKLKKSMINFRNTPLRELHNKDKMNRTEERKADFSDMRYKQKTHWQEEILISNKAVCYIMWLTTWYLLGSMLYNLLYFMDNNQVHTKWGRWKSSCVEHEVVSG